MSEVATVVAGSCTHKIELGPGGESITVWPTDSNGVIIGSCRLTDAEPNGTVEGSPANYMVTIFRCTYTADFAQRKLSIHTEITNYAGVGKYDDEYNW